MRDLFRRVLPRVRGFAPLLALLALALATGRPLAAVRAAEASLSTTQAMVGEAVQLHVQVSSDKKEDLPWPRVEGLEPFTVTKSTNYSSGSQTTIVNGTVSRNEYFVTEFVYTLTPQRTGSFTIGPIRYAHKEFSRDLGSAALTVSKSESGLTTRSSVSKARANVGEQLLYTLRIIPKEGVQSINLPENLQKLIGQKFFFQQLDKEIAPSVAQIDGHDTKVFDIRIALFPLLSGPVTLEGIPVEYRQVRRNSGSQGGQSMADAFEEAFFGGGGRVVTQTVQAAPLRITAVPLPSGAPAGFTGSVGSYTLSAKLDKASVAAGDAVTLTVTIRGNGLPKSITRPVLPDLPGFEVYDPEESAVTEPEGSALWTTKTFKYVLIPGREGEQTVSGIAFPYFDPKRGEYARAEAPPIVLKVAPGKAAPGGGFVAQREISELGADIRYLKDIAGEAKLRDDADLPYHHAPFYALLLLPPFAFAGALGFRRRSERLRSDSALLRRTRAGAQLRKRLKAARQAQEAGLGREFYRALSEALVSYASDKTNQEFRGLTLPEARERLMQAGASRAAADAYDGLAQRCDFVVFAGMTPASEEMRRDLEAGEKLLSQLDRELA